MRELCHSQSEEHGPDPDDGVLSDGNGFSCTTHAACGREYRRAGAGEALPDSDQELIDAATTVPVALSIWDEEPSGASGGSGDARLHTLAVPDRQADDRPDTQPASQPASQTPRRLPHTAPIPVVFLPAWPARLGLDALDALDVSMRTAGRARHSTRRRAAQPIP